MISWQAFFYFPVLLFARLTWAHQSWVFVWGGFGQHSVEGAAIDRKKMQYPVLEKICLVLHYVGLVTILSYMPFVNALCYFILAQTSCGLFLAVVFGLGHNGMAVYPYIPLYTPIYPYMPSYILIYPYIPLYTLIYTHIHSYTLIYNP